MGNDRAISERFWQMISLSLKTTLDQIKLWLSFACHVHSNLSSRQWFPAIWSTLISKFFIYAKQSQLPITVVIVVPTLLNGSVPVKEHWGKAMTYLFIAVFKHSWLSSIAPPVMDWILIKRNVALLIVSHIGKNFRWNKTEIFFLWSTNIKLPCTLPCLIAGFGGRIKCSKCHISKLRNQTSVEGDGFLINGETVIQCRKIVKSGTSSPS